MKNWWKIGAAVAGAIVYTIWDGRRISRGRQSSKLAAGKRFVVVGGGFAGAEAARELTQLLPDIGNGMEVILVDQNDYLLFTPMLTEAVGASIQSHHIIVPLKTFSPRVRQVRGVVKDIDLKTKTVTFQDEAVDAIKADYLVIALGASSNFHGIPGVEKAAFGLKNLSDANGIRQNAMEMVKKASKETDEQERQAELTVIVAGGGYTGVECIAALNELVRETATQEPALTGTPVRMILVEPLDRLMSEVTSDLATYAQKQIESAGVEVKLKVGIKGVNGDEVELSDGERLRAKTFIWTAGVRANPLLEKLGAPTGKSKGLKVDGCFALPNFEGVWAVGDCAEIPEPSGTGNYAQTAQNASREGTVVAQNVVRALRGEAQQPFKYKPVGELALVGKRKGVARIYGLNFSGFTAYALWRAVYIMKMPSMTQRLRVLSDWWLDLMLGPVAEYHVASVEHQKRLSAAQGR